MWSRTVSDSFRSSVDIDVVIQSSLPKLINFHSHLCNKAMAPTNPNKSRFSTNEVLDYRVMKRKLCPKQAGLPVKQYELAI